MNTRRVILVHVDEVRSMLIEHYELFIKDAAKEMVAGESLVPPLVLKGIKNLTPEELVEVANCGFIEMFLSEKNVENFKSPAVAVIMFVPDERGFHKSYLLTPESIFPQDLA